MAFLNNILFISILIIICNCEIKVGALCMLLYYNEIPIQIKIMLNLKIYNIYSYISSVSQLFYLDGIIL